MKTFTSDGLEFLWFFLLLWQKYNLLRACICICLFMYVGNPCLTYFFDQQNCTIEHIKIGRIP